MALALDPNGAVDAQARYLAEACTLAYEPATAGPGAYREKLALEAELVSVGNTQAYVGHDAANLVVAFRGSESPATVDGFKDWFLTNANNLLIVPSGRAGTDFIAAGTGARFHKGFIDALGAVWDPLVAAVEKRQKPKPRRLWVTGHSLGGALALLAAWRFPRQFHDVHRVFTFGAPMIGNEAVSKAYERELGGRIYRYVDDLDPVPRLPTMSLTANEYGHCLREILVGAAGGAAESITGVFQKFADAAKGGITSGVADQLWGPLKQHIDRHFMTNYTAQIDERIKTGAKV
jgi:hypothetical protein